LAPTATVRFAVAVLLVWWNFVAEPAPGTTFFEPTFVAVFDDGEVPNVIEAADPLEVFLVGDPGAPPGTGTNW
jgi:hypothetical protein